MVDQCKLTTLKAEKLDAIIRRDWDAVRRIDEEIRRLENALLDQLWPGAKIA